LKRGEPRGGRDWRIAKELLWNKLDFYFTEPRRSQLLSSFEVVLNRREDIASRIGGLVAQYNNNVNVRPNDAFQKEIRGIFDQIYKNRDDLRQMDKLILEDIEKDAQVPHTLWDYVM